MKVAQVLDWLNSIAPFESAEGFDNVGLLMGNPESEVKCVLFGMDLTEAMAEAAIQLGAELLITHHPFIFHALKRIDYTAPQGNAMCRLMEHHISVIAAHTNWDKAPGGVSDSLAAQLELINIEQADEYTRVGLLNSSVFSEALETFVQDKLQFRPHVYGNPTRSISKIAVAGGSYGEGYMCALSSGAQAFLTGEIAHHEILDACSRGMIIVEAGHYATEIPGVRALYQRFLADAAKANWKVEAHLHDIVPFRGALLA